MLLTIDKNLEFQQNLEKYDIIVAVFEVRQNSVKPFEPLLPVFEAQLPTFVKGQVYRIRQPDTPNDTP